MKASTRTAALFTSAALLLGLAVGIAKEDPQPVTAPPAIVERTQPTQPDPQPDSTRTPLIQIALLLDTSSSMDGLIDQAKSQLWKIVVDLAESRRAGKQPRLEIALFEYGNDGLPSGEGYLRMVLPLTESLDRVSQELFGLTTNGGEEYAGTAIKTAVDRLSWGDRDALKMIFVAGNEPFDQGSVSPRAAMALANARGITVNTIYCGDARNAEASGWKNGAALADGRFMSIDHNAEVAHVAAPQDDRIAELGEALNETYLSFGREGAVSKTRQMAQDANAASQGLGSVVSRSLAKASNLYRNAEWDLVDAHRQKKVDLAAVDADSLPEPMRRMNAAERRTYVEQQSKRRADLQDEIRKLSSERQQFLAKAKQEQGPSTLDSAMLDAVREQATAHGFAF